jgi:hypothetical protein
MMKKISEYFMAYEATKVFAIRKMKMQFTNKNKFRLNLDSLKCHFLDFGGSFDRILMVRKQSFDMIFVMLL